MGERGELTERQRAWFASVRAGLERDTGRTVEQWAELARACPETKPRARLAWMKAEHGLQQNRASLVLNAAFPSDSNWSAPDGLAEALWRDPAARAIFEAGRSRILLLPDVIVGQRKAFTAFSRKVQFAAMRPAGGAVVLGLAVDRADFPSLQPKSTASWSDRLTAEVRITAPDEMPALEDAIRAAWSRS